jgi:hypothetical protein
LLQQFIASFHPPCLAGTPQSPHGCCPIRATVTWIAIRGDDPLKVQQRAGHTSFDTTQEYIRLAESMRVGFGDVFPSLPPELFEMASPGEFRSPLSIAQH